MIHSGYRLTKMRRIILIAILVSITCAAEETKIRTGALVQHQGQIKIISNILILKKNLTGLIECEAQASEMKEIIGKIKEKDQDNVELLEGLQQNLNELVGSRKKSPFAFCW